MDWFRHDVGMVRHPRIASLAHHLHRPRLVVYAHVCAFYEGIAQHAETGQLDSITDDLIETWAEWPGKPGALAGAMREVGIIDTVTVHGWLRRHEYAMRERDRKRAACAQNARSLRAERAQPARAVRAVGSPPPPPPSPPLLPPHTPPSSPPSPSTPFTPMREPSGSLLAATAASGHSSSTALFPGALDPDPKRAPPELVRRWNTLAAELGLPQAEKLTPKRSLAAMVQIRAGLLDRWDEFAAGLRGSPHHLGVNDRCWKANFDWLMRPDRWLAVIECASAPPLQHPVTHDRGPTRRPLSRAERNKADMDSVDWDAIDRERAELGLDREEGEATT